MICYGTPANTAAVVVDGGKKYQRDITRLVLNTNKIGLSGVMTEALLYEKYNIRIEMSDKNSIVMIATIADTVEDFEVLKNALAGIAAIGRGIRSDNRSDNRNDDRNDDRSDNKSDNRSGNRSDNKTCELDSHGYDSHGYDSREQCLNKNDFSEQCLNKNESPTMSSQGERDVVFTQSFHKHLHRAVKQVDLTRAAGMTAASMITPYPPGVPLLLPGEEITPELSDIIVDMLHTGICMNGIGRDRLITVYDTSAKV